MSVAAVVPGRFHVVTAGQGAFLRDVAMRPDVSSLTIALCAADRAGTRRHPLPADVREAQLRAVLGDRVHIARVADTADDAAWAAAVAATAPGARVFLANRDVAQLFARTGVDVAARPPQGPTPADVIDAIATGRPWEPFVDPAVLDLLRAHADAIRAVARRPLVNEHGELAHGRDFDSYGAQMDAALAQKLADLGPWVVPGCVVDKGCGTGKLMVELSRRFPESAFVGVDLSREFLRRCDENTYFSDDVALVPGDARDPAVPDGAATTVILSSIVHEIWTYAGYQAAAVDRALASAFRELSPGGRLLIRDGVSPGDAPWRMRLLRADVADVFRRFAAEFKHGAGAPHAWLDAATVRLSAHLANEFLCKKDYQKNWHIEVHEEFGVDTVAGWRRRLAGAGFVVRDVRAYVNDWIAANRYAGSVALFDDAGRSLPWPDTNVVAVAEKPA